MVAVLEAFTIPPFGENTYLFGDPETGDAVVIDPGGRVDDIMGAAERRGLTIRRILNTHAHVDHVLGVDELRRRTGARFALHPQATATLEALPAQARQFGLPPAAVPEIDDPVEPGSPVSVGRHVFEVRDTPGHALGHVTFVARDVELDGEPQAQTLAFCGDVIFRGSIGRTDLEGGDLDLLMRSIRDQILTLPDDTVLLSGHGPATTVGYERQYNPFLLQWQSEVGR